jgi:quinol monooxygenase YgiN
VDVYYLRLSLARPVKGRAEEARRLEEELLSYFAAQEGFVGGYQITAREGSREIGRITIWKSEEVADQAATSPHVMALRSKLLTITEEERVEMAFEAAESG